MGISRNKLSLFIGLALLLAVGLPVGIYISQQSQDVRSKASASTTLYFSPEASLSNPIKKNVGDAVSLDVWIHPGTNMPSIAKFSLHYDSTKLKPKQLADVFRVNTESFPTVIEGPTIKDGTLYVAVSIGPDVLKAIKTPTKVGTFIFVAVAPTADSATMVSFGSDSAVLSIAPSDQSTENVLSTTVPAYVNIVDGSKTATSISCGQSPVVLNDVPKNFSVNLSAGNTKLASKAIKWSSPNQNVIVHPGSSLTDTAGEASSRALVSVYYPTAFTTTIIATFAGDSAYAASTCSMQASYTPIAPTPTPVITNGLSFNVFMHGIGGSGDNTNPTSSSLSNKKPEYPTRTFKVFVSDTNNQEVASIAGLLIYSSASGSFKGTVALPDTFASSGAYLVKAESPGHLQRRISGIRTIVSGQINTMPDAALVAGDINSDNALDIRDYNLLISFYADLKTPGYFNSILRLMSDINDDGLVNQVDYNLFLREISVQAGD